MAQTKEILSKQAVQTKEILSKQAVKIAKQAEEHEKFINKVGGCKVLIFKQFDVVDSIPCSYICFIL